MKNMLFLLVLVISFSCTNGAETPEGLIEMFVKDVSTKKIDRDYYQKFTTGKFLEVVESLSDEDLEKNERMAGVDDVSVKIISKSCQDDKCVLTYIVKYNTNSKEDKSFASEVKKVAEVVKSGEDWKLSDLRNMKTYHESEEAINPMQDEAPASDIPAQE